jgi:hypothetical protein
MRQAPKAPLARAADVEVHLVVAVLLDQTRAGGKFLRLAAAELRANRALGLIVAEVALCVAVQQRACGDHLGEEERGRRDLAQEEPAMPVGPVHHRRYGNPVLHLVVPAY